MKSCLLGKTEPRKRVLDVKQETHYPDEPSEEAALGQLLGPNLLSVMSRRRHLPLVVHHRHHLQVLMVRPGHPADFAVD